jgi:hypothetical protein
VTLGDIAQKIGSGDYANDMEFLVNDRQASYPIRQHKFSSL